MLGLDDMIVTDGTRVIDVAKGMTRLPGELQPGVHTDGVRMGKGGQKRGLRESNCAG